MVRFALVLLLLALEARAHGGAFRPPPPRPTRDPSRPGGRLTTTPSVRTAAQRLSHWMEWWVYHREHLLRLRARITKRTVITGPNAPTDFFDRDKLREELVPVFLEALHDREPDVRVAAAIALGRTKAKQAKDALRAHWRTEKELRVREAVAIGLLLLEDASLRDWFRALARDGDQSKRMRGFGVLALGLLQDTDFLIRVLLHDRTLKLAGGRPALEELRSCAAVALGFSGSPLAVMPLARVAHDKQAPRNTRGYAAAALGRLGDPLAIPDVLSMLKPQALNEIRYGGSIALGRLVQSNEHGLIDQIGKHAQRDKDGGVRALLFLSLGEIGGDHAATYVVSELRTREQTVRGFIILALGLSGGKDVADILRAEYRRIKNTDDRGACALAFGLLDDKAAAGIIRKELGRNNAVYLPFGLLAAGLLDDTAAIPLVRQHLASGLPDVAGEAALALALLRRGAAVPELLDAFQNAKSTPVRMAIASVLGTVGTRRAVDPLLNRYRNRKDTSYERALALAVLGRIVDVHPIPTLSRFALDYNPYVRSEALSVLVTIL